MTTVERPEPEDERDRLIALLESAISWGYVRAGNAYARPQKPKHQPEPLDVAPEDAPHG
jgi:hypothetical protein